MPSTEIVLLIAAAIFVGSLVQGAVGLGIGLVGAPVLTLVAPELMPGTILWLATVLPVFTLAREWRAIDWWGLRWAFLGRIPATAVGAWIVSVVSAQALGIMVGVMILAAVVLTVRTVRLPMWAPVLVGAGVVSGVTGTATSIGGPPLALLYQRELGPRVRSTLAAYFVVGAGASLIGLAFVGALTMAQTVTAWWLALPMAAGFAMSGPVRRVIDGDRLRIAVLGVCAASALAVLVRSLFG